MRRSRAKVLRRRRWKVFYWFRRWVRSPKGASVAVSVGVHAAIIIALLLIIAPGQMRRATPSMVVVAEPKINEAAEMLKDRRRAARETRKPSPRIQVQQVVANTASPVFLNTVDIEVGEENVPDMGFGTGLGASWEAMTGAGFKSQESRIGTLFVRASKLGVVLDDSPSMSPFLPKLRSEIRKGFRGCVFREVTGCHLGPTNGRTRPVMISYYDPAAVMRSFKELVEEHKVDAIYWFSDLQDGETEEALAELRELLRIRASGGKRPVRFYVCTMDEKPSKQLQEIIDDSGGEVDTSPPT